MKNWFIGLWQRMKWCIWSPYGIWEIRYDSVFGEETYYQVCGNYNDALFYAKRVPNPRIVFIG